MTILRPCPAAGAQQSPRPSAPQARTSEKAQDAETGAESELQTGIALTRQGKFAEAIPHFLVAQGKVADEFALQFDLALCYVATDQFTKAIPILNSLRSGHERSDLENLLAQAYLGNAQPAEALEAFRRAAELSPQSEKLYLFVADACIDHQYYASGLEVVNLGLRQLPRSSRLFYQRGVLHSFMDQPDLARSDLEQAGSLAQGSDISYLAASQKGMLDGNLSEAIQAARRGVQNDPNNYVLLTILGQALIRSGAAPGQSEFAEAESALQRAVILRPGFAAAQLALGQLCRMDGRLDEAVKHLETARQLAPNNAAAYSNLALVYRAQGKTGEAQKILAALADLNRQSAAKYKLGPPDQKASYMGTPTQK